MNILLSSLNWSLATLPAFVAQTDVLNDMKTNVGKPLWGIVAIVTLILLAIESVVIVVMIQSKRVDNLMYWIIGAVILAAIPAIIAAVYAKWEAGPFGAILPFLNL